MKRRIALTAILLFFLGIPASAQSLRHPGTVLDSAEVLLMKKRTASGEIIWNAAKQKLLAEADLSYLPRALEYIMMGAGGVSYDMVGGKWIKNPNGNQHSVMIKGAEHAIAYAYAYLLTGNEAYPGKVVEILKGWGQKCVKVYPKSGDAGFNNPLEVGWMVSGLARAAEILKYSYPGWAATGAEEQLLAFWSRHESIMTPFPGWGPNNWHGTMLEAMMMMAMLKNDAYKFHSLCSVFVDLMITKGIRADGLTYDTGRDSWHGQSYLGGLLQGAEIAYHQGIDLYKAGNYKIFMCMEANAKYGLSHGWTFIPVWEIGYNHYKHRLGIAMPYTEEFLRKSGSAARPDDIHFHWGAQFLTHSNTAGSINSTRTGNRSLGYRGASIGNAAYSGPRHAITFPSPVPGMPEAFDLFDCAGKCVGREHPRLGK